jgi:hypothetical protein
MISNVRSRRVKPFFAAYKSITVGCDYLNEYSSDFSKMAIERLQLEEGIDKKFIFLRKNHPDVLSFT